MHWVLILSNLGYFIASLKYGGIYFVFCKFLQLFSSLNFTRLKTQNTRSKNDSCGDLVPMQGILPLQRVVENDLGSLIYI